MTPIDTPSPARRRWIGIGAVALVLVAAATFALLRKGDAPAATADKTVSAAKSGGPTRPALSVATTTPQSMEWPRTLAANGNIVAWQEAVIGAEVGGQRLTEVRVNVGDIVQRGQVLAVMAAENIQADLAQSRALAAEAEAALAEATANADRARSLAPTGVYSGQQLNQILTAEQTAKARLNSARARVQADELRLSQTRVVAPDDGVISARTATVGSLMQPGQELFRLIRGGRLEWRAEVTATELARIKAGQTATVVAASGARVTGKVRMVGPTIDPGTRNGLVYVDLPRIAADNPVKAGMFARGELELGRGPALTLPQSAVLLRDGFSYVFRVEADARVTQLKVETGRRSGERIEILDGLAPDARVVASGAAFLADGDLVRIVNAPTQAAQR